MHLKNGLKFTPSLPDKNLEVGRTIVFQVIETFSLKCDKNVIFSFPLLADDVY